MSRLPQHVNGIVFLTRVAQSSGRLVSAFGWGSFARRGMSLVAVETFQSVCHFNLLPARTSCRVQSDLALHLQQALPN